MAATNLRARSYFSKLLNKAGDVTPRPEPIADHAEGVEMVEPISRVEAIEPINDDHIAGPSKKNKKRARSGKRSHSSSRRHRHAEGVSTQFLP